MQLATSFIRILNLLKNNASAWYGLSQIQYYRERAYYLQVEVKQILNSLASPQILTWKENEFILVLA